MAATSKIIPSVQSIKAELSKVSTGYGLMSLTWRPTPAPQEKAFAAMKKVVEYATASKCKAFFNVGEFYGPDRMNLTYVRDFFKQNPTLREHVIISCKGALDVHTFLSKGKYQDVLDSVSNSVEAIGGYIDIFEVARLDNGIVPAGEVYPKESFEALAKMVDEGKIGGISLSEVNEGHIRAIAKDFGPYLTCVEVELSLFSTHILKDGVAKACSDLELIIICYSPLGRGLLSGEIKSNDDIPVGDIRKTMKRFNGEWLQQNLKLTEFLRDEIINKRPQESRISLPQVALGWIKKWNHNPEFPGTRFIPIPSGSGVSRVEENFDEAKVQISEAEFEMINKYLKEFVTSGDRYEQA
ncbi:aldo/keto reductase family protein KNAG_0A07840 [Huiozyma naganishii CBS 8797]|uniref:NADP-dependent oxidoreductase domain-containing protein n=1 Tax=Huiozyma naganishii (strain ATCC MYA-139 / BCRC 22969 / CBS 8797 / KCTC 17520 / NBRC 10181 / NCYC 3082 / Yp74L-3) TaxID=1071383 RepID=J7S484_HUIN7|nr:hypothetical protein KNAG_0A07840 [Kazachstania naganishii CBS 8797]CCK68436.1 hypothetical protein KNAG_0A07840 [Kazachstania naganishii CBS 8797]